MLPGPAKGVALKLCERPFLPALKDGEEWGDKLMNAEIPYGANAALILAAAKRALRKAGCTDEQIGKYLAEAKSGDYDHLVEVTETWMENHE